MLRPVICRLLECTLLVIFKSQREQEKSLIISVQSNSFAPKQNRVQIAEVNGNNCVLVMTMRSIVAIATGTWRVSVWNLQDDSFGAVKHLTPRTLESGGCMEETGLRI